MSFLFASFWVKIIQATTMIDFLKTTLKDFKNAKNEIHKIHKFLVYQFY